MAREAARPTFSRRAFALTERAQILAVPGGGNGFAGRVGARLIGARRDSLLAEFADVPILPVGHVPEFDGVLGVEARVVERRWMKKPITKDQGAFGRLRPDLV